MNNLIYLFEPYHNYSIRLAKNKKENKKKNPLKLFLELKLYVQEKLFDFFYEQSLEPLTIVKKTFCLECISGYKRFPHM